MWWITTSLNSLNVGVYLQTTLLIKIAHVLFRDCRSSTEGSNSTSWTSFTGFWANLVSAMGVTTLANSAYWWVQWRDLFPCSFVWILAWTSKSTLSPTILDSINFILEKYFSSLNRSSQSRLGVGVKLQEKRFDRKLGNT